MIKPFTLFLCLFAQAYAVAESPIFGDDSLYPKVRDLNWLNQNYLNKQRERANSLARENFGMRIKTAQNNENTMDNIRIIQRLISEDKLKSASKEELQSLGVVLGDIYVDQVKALEWKVYEDELGNSHAVCVKNTKHCLFPVTMISRRIEGGLKPDMDAVYEKGLDFMWDYLPKLPFS